MTTTKRIKKPSKKERIFKLVKDFVETHEITSPEAITNQFNFTDTWDSDTEEFLNNCCHIIGYYREVGLVKNKRRVAKKGT